jgi:hypothetical protein
MNKKALLIGMGLILVLCIAFIQASQRTAYANEARVIRIYGGSAGNVSSIRIEPKFTTVSPDTVIIWNNWARASEVKVVFEEGKVCQDVTKAPMGFTLNAQHCFVTTWIPLGGTSSLRFMDKGVYKYTIQTTGGVKEAGEIRVR